MHDNWILDRLDEMLGDKPAPLETIRRRQEGNAGAPADNTRVARKSSRLPSRVVRPTPKRDLLNAVPEPARSAAKVLRYLAKSSAESGENVARNLNKGVARAREGDLRHAALPLGLAVGETALNLTGAPEKELPERIVAVASKHDASKRIFTGPIHILAQQAGEEQGLTGHYARGYITSRGRFVDGDDARAIAKLRKQSRKGIPVGPIRSEYFKSGQLDPATGEFIPGAAKKVAAPMSMQDRVALQDYAINSGAKPTGIPSLSGVDYTNGVTSDPTMDRARKLYDAIKGKSGFTINPHTGESVTEGYAVGAGKGLGGLLEIPVDKLSPEVLAAHMAKHPVPEGSLYGGWVDNGKVYIEPSTHVMDKDMAVDLGFKRKEKAIGDLAKYAKGEDGTIPVTPPTNLPKAPRRTPEAEAEALQLYRLPEMAGLTKHYPFVPVLDKTEKQVTPKIAAMKSSKKEINQRVEDAWRKLSQPVPTEYPKPHGVLDRSVIKPDEGVTPGPLPERMPFGPKQAQGHIQGLYSDENANLIDAQIRRGLTMVNPHTGKAVGEMFYPSYAAVDDAIGNLGGDPNLFRQSTSAAAIRNGVENEIINGSLMYHIMKQGIITPEEIVAASKLPPAERKVAYEQMADAMRAHGAKMAPDAKGFMLMKGHPQALAGLMQNEFDAYKIPMYDRHKAGNVAGFVLDTHGAKSNTLVSPYHNYFAEQGGFKSKGEYGAAEKVLGSVVRNLGLPDRAGQALQWGAAGGITGLRTDPVSDYAQIFEDVLMKNAQHRNESPRSLLGRVARGETFLYDPRVR